MKRDLELIRKMLLEIDDSPPGWAPDMKFDGYDDGQVGYHAHLLIEAKLATGHDAGNFGGDAPFGFITHLTDAGHEFAQAARNDARWEKALAGLAKVLDGIMKWTRERP